MDLDDFLDEIHRKGFKKIGHGASAEVFGKGNEVYKVYEELSSAPELKFLQYCITHKEKNLQKVLKFSKNGKWGYIKTILYKKIPISDWRSNKMLLGLRLYAETKEQSIIGAGVRGDTKSKNAILANFLKSSLYKSIHSLETKKLGSYSKSLDMHDRNYMYDTSKNIIIVDI